MAAMVPAGPAGPAAAVAAQRETGEEDGANDEHDAGDDRHPGSGLVDPGGPVLMWTRQLGGRGLGLLLSCFSHVAILTDPV